MKSRTREITKVITSRNAIKSAKYAPTIAKFDPLCDPRHLAFMLAK